MAGGRPIETEIKLDVDSVVSGAEKVADSFEEIQDSAKDTAKAGEKSFEQVEDSAKDASKVIDRDLTKALEEVEDKAKSTGRTIGKSVKDGTDKAGEGMEELKGESASTAKEAAASFGSIEDAADALQEVAANAFVGFGPAGMAAGILAAAGIGLAISALTDQADKINENKEKMLGLAQAMKDNGGELSMGDYIQSMEDYGYAIQDTKEWFEIFQQDAVSGFEKLKGISDDTGLSMKDLFNGAFGDADEAKAILEDVEGKIQDVHDKEKALYDLEGVILHEVDGAALGSLEEAKRLIEENIKAQEAAEVVEKARRAAIEGTVAATLEDIAALEKKNGLLQDGVTSELDYRDQVEQTSAVLAENGATLDINTQAGRDNQRSLIEQSDAALQMAQSQLTAGTSADTVAASLAGQREQLLVTLDAMTGNRAESERLAASLGLIPTEVITEVKTNGAVESKAEIEQIPATAETDVTVDDGGTAAQTQARVNSLEGTDIKIDVQDFNTVSQTQGRIDGIKGKDVKIDVQDFNSVRDTQNRINDLKGKDVDINVRIANLGDIQRQLDNLTAARSVTLTVNERKGTSETP